MTNIRPAKIALCAFSLFASTATDSGSGTVGAPYPNMPHIAPIGTRIGKYVDVPESAKGPAIDSAKGYRLQKLGKGLYMITDNAYQSMFMTYERGVVVVDAPPSYAGLIPRRSGSYRQADYAFDLQPLAYRSYCRRQRSGGNSDNHCAGRNKAAAYAGERPKSPNTNRHVPRSLYAHGRKPDPGALVSRERTRAWKYLHSSACSEGLDGGGRHLSRVDAMAQTFACHGYPWLLRPSRGNQEHVVRHAGIGTCGTYRHQGRRGAPEQLSERSEKRGCSSTRQYKAGRRDGSP